MFRCPTASVMYPNDQAIANSNAPTVINAIVYHNGSRTGLAQMDSASATVNYSDVQDGWSGMGNINADPFFLDADGRLLAGSPCIDAGDDAVVPFGVTTDLDGNLRIQGLCVDMGAFEAPTDPEEMLRFLCFKYPMLSEEEIKQVCNVLIILFPF